MDSMSVNFNTKSIFLEDSWYTIEELTEKIKYNLNKGNFKIHKLSLALEKLEETLKSAKEIKFVIDNITYEKYERLSKLKSRPIEDFFRNALYHYIISLENKNLEFKEKEESSIEISEENLIKKKKPEVIKEKPEVIDEEDSWYKKD